MNIQILSPVNAFNPGSDLWCLPHFEHSRWVKKVDWYLNFQLTKSLLHEKKVHAPQLTKLIEDTGSPIFKSPLPEKKSLMISSDKLLPNRWTIMVPYEQNISLWVSEIQKIYTQMKSPTLRIFLPHNEEERNFELEFKKRFPTTDFIIVLDS